jgi:HAD superfamily hydrolase (TIGR01509 family)
MPPRAVLFDFDGVIADTENVHVAAWQRTFAAMGWEVSDELCARAMELDDRHFLAGVFARRGVGDGDVEGWVRRKQELTHQLLTDSPRVYPGVAALVERVKAKGPVKLAVVTTTWRANVVTVLKSSGLYPAFSLIVGKESVRATKPDPEPYRLAVESLKVRPSEAVALEDSESGLTSARLAGVRAVAVGHRHPLGAWIGKSEYVPDFSSTALVMVMLGFRIGR